MAVKLTKARRAARKLRIAVYGRDSVGKTHFALSAPGPVVVFDSEGRIDSMTDKFGDIPIVQFEEKRIVQDYVEAARDFRLGKINDEHGVPFNAFVTDSWTTIEKLFRNQSPINTVVDGPERTKNLGDLRKSIENELLNPAFTGPTKCHFIVIAHSANDWGKNAKDQQAVIGTKPDATRNFKHYFDLVFYMEREVNTPANAEPKRWATVIKSNYQHILPIGMRIDNLSWDHPLFAQLLNDEVQIIPVPTTELVALHAKAGAPDGTLGQWLTANHFQLANNRLIAEDTHRAKGMLESIIEDGEALEVPA